MKMTNTLDMPSSRATHTCALHESNVSITLKIYFDATTPINMAPSGKKGRAVPYTLGMHHMPRSCRSIFSIKMPYPFKGF